LGLETGFLLQISAIYPKIMGETRRMSWIIWFQTAISVAFFLDLI